MPRWTKEARQKQSEIQKTRQSWKHSTGPKTAAGKKRSSMNALKHGMHDRATRSMRRFLRLNGQFLTALNKSISLQQRDMRMQHTCHPERRAKPAVEGSQGILRFAQNDSFAPRNITANPDISNGCELIFTPNRHIFVGTTFRPSAFSANKHHKITNGFP